MVLELLGHNVKIYGTQYEQHMRVVFQWVTQRVKSEGREGKGNFEGV